MAKSLNPATRLVFEAGRSIGKVEGRRAEVSACMRIFNDESMSTFERIDKIQRRWLLISRKKRK